MPYDYENTNPEPLVLRWTAARLKQTDISRYTGISDTRISQVVTRQSDFSYPEWMKIDRFLEHAEEVIRRMRGAPNWKNFEAISKLISEIENERRNPPPPPSDTDLQIYARFALGDDLDAIAFDFKMSNSDVLACVEAVLKRGATLLRTLPPAGEQLIG
jgi:hypothetical protein